MPKGQPIKDNKEPRDDLETLVEETVRGTLDEVLALAIAAAIKKASSLLGKRIDSCFTKMDELKEETDGGFAEVKKEIEKMKRENNLIDTETRLKTFVLMDYLRENQLTTYEIPYVSLLRPYSWSLPLFLQISN